MGVTRSTYIANLPKIQKGLHRVENFRGGNLGDGVGRGGEVGCWNAR